MIDLTPYLVGAAFGVAGLALLPLSGLLPSSAEPGQPAVLDWYFNAGAQQSITLRSLMTEVPPLDVQGMAERGAGHYEMVCADCHGSPAAPAQQFARNLSPSPPLLVERMGQWHPAARVFATVKHGIGRTAMPGWPAQLRDDEVWDMVAFLRALPELEAAQYSAIAGRSAADQCAGCHGAQGQGIMPGVPRLDIQTPAYLETALKAYRDGTRQSGTMMAAARQLSDGQIRQLAEQYGRQLAAPGTRDAAEIERVIAQGIPERDVPACASCHDTVARPDYPRLEGQDSGYLIRQLKLFKELNAERGGPNAHIMAEVVRFLEEDDMKALADWYAP